MAKHGADGAYYGHCSVGCLHIRPLINLKTERGLEQVRDMAEEIFDLVLEFGGAISSEHGDGRARSPFLERVFGPAHVPGLPRVKAPSIAKGRMNPGNIVASPGVTEHLRYGAEYKTWEPKTLLDFSAQGGFAAAVEMCNGVGVCRKKLEGTMCPSYMATRDEEHTTRGRANALRAVLSGKVPAADFAGKRLYEVMDLCLECKGCKAECPSNVDMAKMKYEFLHHYHAGQRPAAAQPPLRAHRAAVLARLAPGPDLATGSRARAPNRWLMERVAGIDRRRPLPAFARETFTDWFDRRRAPAEAPRGDVVLFHDTFITYNAPEIGRAAVELLEAAGYRVELVDKKCCGRPLISKGMLDEAKAHAEWNVARLLPWVDRGAAIVGLEPSCLLTLRDEYGRAGAHRRGAASGGLRLSSGRVPAARARARSRRCPSRQATRASRRCSTATATRRRMVGTAPTVAALPLGRATRWRRWTPAAAAWPAPSASSASTTTSR